MNTLHRLLAVSITMTTALGVLAPSGVRTEGAQLAPGPTRHHSVPPPGFKAPGKHDATSPACSSPAYVLTGINFSPYEDGQDPNVNPAISAAQITERMQIIAPCTTWVRTYSVTNGMEAAGGIAHGMGLKIAAGAWIGSDPQSNQAEITSLINLANAGQADLLIVGSEALLRNDVSDSQLISYIQQVRQAVPSGLQITTADTYSVLLLHQNVIDACDVVLVNYYPCWAGIAVDVAMTSLNNWHKQMLAVAGTKPVIVSETGWPSDGNAIGNAVPTLANASYYFLDFVSWARANNVFYFYFEAFDETWKANYEGPQGAHWGILDKDGNLKPGFDQVFQGVTLADNWDCNGVVGGSGTPSIALTYVPPYGSYDTLAGQALHVAPASNDVVVYISVNGGGTWWIKPYNDQPITYCQCDGTWTADITTGGSDEDATAIAAFLIPNTYSPPLLLGQPLPSALYQNSLANVQVSRSTNSISGLVADASGNPVNGVTLTLTGPETQTTVTLNGKYSFYDLASSSNYTVAPSAPNYVFSPPSQTFATVTANQVANFVATASADLSISQTAIPSPVVALGQNITYKLVVANAGPGAASNVMLKDTLSSGVALVSVGSDSGSCSGTTTIMCNLGGLVLSGSTSVTIVVQATATGSVTNTATVTADQPDLNPANNTSMVTTTVGIPAPNLSPSAYSFPIQTVGTTGSTQAIGLGNTGSAPLTIASILISGGNAADFSASHNCPIAPDSLAVGGQCSINVGFTPSAGGPRKSSVSIANDAPGNPARVILTGVGTALGLSTNAEAFFNQTVGTSSASQVVTLTNAGSTSMHLWQIAISGPNAGDFSKASTCNTSLGAGASCTVSVTFTPTAVGPRTAVLLFSDDGGGSPQAVGLAGTGVPAASFSHERSPLSFGARP